MHYSYILRCEDQSLYTGYTNDIKKRLLSHLSGRGAKYTRSHKPKYLVHIECFLDKSEALKREAEIKAYSKNEKESLCNIKFPISRLLGKKVIAEKLLSWYQANKRPLPWRDDPIIPYQIWLSEIMAQQTRMTTVVPYYEAFLEKFPDIESLASAKEDDVLKQWEGLGYYSRARNLHKAAKLLNSEYDAQLPKTAKELKKLPGIGDYTAAAIASIAFGEAVPAVDGNVLRVASRLEAFGEDISLPKSKESISKIVGKWIPKDASGDFTQAMMELGAVICTPKQASCASCPLKEICLAFSIGLVSNLPFKQSAKKPKILHRAVLLMQDENERWLLRKRKERLLNGLWEFPGWDCKAGQEKASLKKLLQSWNLPSTKNLKSIGHAKHVFTHLQWEMEGYYIQTQATFKAPDGYEWKDASVFEKEAWPTALQFYRKQALKISSKP